MLGIGGAKADSNLTGPIPGRYVVKLVDGSSKISVDRALSSRARLNPISADGRTSVRPGAETWRNVYQVVTDDLNLTVDSLAEMIGRDRIEYIEPDYYLEFYDYPTDPLFDYQWYLNNTGQDYLGVIQASGAGNDHQAFVSGLAGIDINYKDQLFSPPSDTAAVVVAVIDGGVDLIHPEMQGQLWKNPDEIPFNGLDDDHNGFVDDTLGWDLSGDSADILNIIPDNDATDFDGHGSHIAGIIASRSDGVGIVGISPFVKILPVKTRPNATSSVGAAGIVYSVNSGAKIINISWGTPFESLILKEAIDYARENGVFIAIAAGNSGDNSRNYPAAFDSSFAVAALTSDGYLTSFSTWGAHVDIVAPGLDILSIRAAGTDLYADGGEAGVHIVDGEPDDSLYFLANGTSMAAPMVAGAAAMLWAYRPDLSLNELEEALRSGADDMVDPLNQGDSYPGVDTISGYGMLNVQAALDYAIFGGVHLVTPLRNQRYDAPFEIRMAAVDGYTGSWELYYSTGVDPLNFSLLASGGAVPSDSIAYLFDPVGVNDKINLRLVDKLNREFEVSFYYVTSDGFSLTSPSNNEQFKYDMRFDGSVFGPGYDSLAIYYRNGTSTEVRIAGSSREFFDEHIYTWNISGLEPGNYSMIVYKHFGGTVEQLIVPVEILSSYTAGWPRQLTGRGGLSPVVADLNNDGFKEVIVGTVMGINGFSHDGQPLDGWPVLPEVDLRGVSAAYDIDRDGLNEIIAVDETGLHAFNYDGSYVAGFPVPSLSDGLISGWPVPTITKFGEDADSAIGFISTTGTIYAYEFNGDSYFYSMQGWYASLIPVSTGPSFNSSVTLSSADLTGDGQIELSATYSGSLGSSGIHLLRGRNGQPAFNQPSAVVLSSYGINGTLLADVDNDGRLELVANGKSESGDLALWVIDNGVDIAPGWPVVLAGTAGWLSGPATVADLDLDGSPEIIVSLHEFDIGSIYAFRADGTPYLSREGRPDGELFFEPVTLGPPIVADVQDDAHPEILVRSGYILPGTGPERVYVIDYNGDPVPGWPIVTATDQETTFSTPFAPLVDDVDNDGLVELVLVGEGNTLFVWDLQASSVGGTNVGRLYHDNLNSGVFPNTWGPDSVRVVNWSGRGTR